MQAHLCPSPNLESHGDPVGWESDHQARTALLQPGPGSWPSPQVLTTQRADNGAGHAPATWARAFQPGKDLAAAALLLLVHRAAAWHKHAKTCQNNQGPQSVNVG